MFAGENICRGAARARELACAALILSFSVSAGATPPAYATLGREQLTAIPMNADEILRIWVVYVGQGDGIVIQLPERSSRQLPGGAKERIDVMVDAGAQPGADRQRMTKFVRALYPGGPVQIEHAVVTHHDQDHFLGFTTLFQSTDVGVERVYHNGLAFFGAGKRGLPATGAPPPPSLYKMVDNVIARALGRFDAQERLLSGFVMDDLAELRQSVAGDELAGDYEDFASALVTKTSPLRVLSFDRVRSGVPFIDENEPGLQDVSFELLWPDSAIRKHGDWGKTINGNSVTFRLRYRDFEMLFTGDHNEPSQEALLRHLDEQGELDKLRADVLKVPHHGSRDTSKDFVDAVGPVMSVASQGKKGATSKAMSGVGWEHPSTKLIGWLGGAHRVYLTELHERRFDWGTITDQAKLEAIRERTHVLVETNGHWFRVVEIPAPEQGGADVLLSVPTMTATLRGDGTRWIKARE